MTDLRAWCDRCGERIHTDRSILNPKCGPLRSRGPIDLCGDCASKLTAEFLTPGAVVPEATAPCPPPPSAAPSTLPRS
jgi:hypothetical protein